MGSEMCIRDRGSLVINDLSNNAIRLYGASASSNNDSQVAEVTFSVPARFWKAGRNKLFFSHESTGGSTINSARVAFDLEEDSNLPNEPDLPIDPGLSANPTDREIRDYASFMRSRLLASPDKIGYGASTTGGRNPVVVRTWDEIVSASQTCLLYTSPSPRDATLSRMPSSA